MARQIPQGLEVLVAKASVDPEFRAVLLKRGDEAATWIGLPLEPAEAAMLAAVPREQLEAIIARVHVPEQFRAAFLGSDLSAMRAAVAATPDAAWEVEEEQGAKRDWRRSRADSPAIAPTGIRPDSTPMEVYSRGIRPFGIPFRWLGRWFSRGSGERGEETPNPPVGDSLPPLVERLLYKAAADADFAEKLLRERSAAAPSVGVMLRPADAAIVDSMPAAQLTAAVEATRKRSRTETTHEKLKWVGVPRGIQPDRPTS